MGSGLGWPPGPAARSSGDAAPRAASVSRHSLASVKRRHRLSRSRDFDAVFRRGSSVSSRYLVLYSFPREGESGGSARLGLAVPRQVGGSAARNRVKRRLRAAFEELTESIPASRDYVLIVRPGFAEAAEAHGFEWVRERVEEVFGRAGRPAEARP